MAVQYQVQGTTMPTLDITLGPGEAVFTEKGGMAWMSGDIAMDTNARGGLLGGIGRRLAGESFFMTTYRCNSGQGLITFTPEAPGTILPMEMSRGEALICQKDAFMCAAESASVEMHFRQKLGTGLFGGEGLFLAKLTGPGRIWLQSMPLANLAAAIQALLPGGQ
jgi:uncharacterized protein (AIM24 family)